MQSPFFCDTATLSDRRAGEGGVVQQNPTMSDASDGCACWFCPTHPRHNSCLDGSRSTVMSIEYDRELEAMSAGSLSASKRIERCSSRFPTLHLHVRQAPPARCCGKGC